MKATIKYCKEKFKEFNSLIFGGRLPELPIELSDAGTFLGKCCYEIRRLRDGRVENHNFRLRINTRIDLPEKVVEDTIIHEMIHYFIAWNQLRDSSSHGPLFMAMMNSINAAYGRHLTVSHKSTPEQRAQAVSTKRTWHVIAGIRGKGGKFYVKVLPRVQQKILLFAEQINRIPDLVDIELYLHDNPFFNQFPTSTALRLMPIDEERFHAELTGAHRLRISNGRLIQS